MCYKSLSNHRKILELRPGITSLASIKYANEIKILAKVEDPEKYNEEVIYPDKVRMELEYYYNHTFLGDLKLIWWTVFTPPPYPPLYRLLVYSILSKKKVKSNACNCPNATKKLIKINAKQETYKFSKQTKTTNKFIVNCLRICNG
ncbi:MAG: sugar transferase, partial [Flavobacteriaceae bacterium]|nr:sugar transferase [Flavobacteriaceae bacterium]